MTTRIVRFIPFLLVLFFQSCLREEYPSNLREDRPPAPNPVVNPKCTYTNEVLVTGEPGLTGKVNMLRKIFPGYEQLELKFTHNLNFIRITCYTPGGFDKLKSQEYDLASADQNFMIEAFFKDGSGGYMIASSGTLRIVANHLSSGNLKVDWCDLKFTKASDLSSWLCEGGFLLKL